MTQPLDIVLSLTAVLSGYNALYFATYLPVHRSGRRLGPRVLMLVNVAIGIESLAFGLMPRFASKATGLATISQGLAAALSLAAGRGIVERIRNSIEARQAEQRVPTVAPVRSAPDLSGLSTQEKIAYALLQQDSGR